MDDGIEIKSRAPESKPLALFRRRALKVTTVVQEGSLGVAARRVIDAVTPQQPQVPIKD